VTPALAIEGLLILAAAAGEGGGGALAFQKTMVVWTWIVFGLVSLVLYKAAWKPILSALDAREERVRNALAEARQAEDSLVQLEETRRRLLAETEVQTETLIAEARRAAAQAAETVEKRAQDKVRILYENAERDIEALRQRVESDLRGRHVELVVQLAGRVVQDNMDTEKNRQLVDRLLAELP
jgi:F-type H+-transporting ATPase subunit b